MTTATATATSSGARARGLGALGVLAVAAAWPADRAEDGPVVCPFRLATGQPCPLCGLTRSFVYTMHGRLDDAFAVHLLGPALVLLAVVWVVAWRTGRAAWADPNGWTRGRARPWFAVALALWAVYAVGRLVLP